jgi:hypothetical protein
MRCGGVAGPVSNRQQGAVAIDFRRGALGERLRRISSVR